MQAHLHCDCVRPDMLVTDQPMLGMTESELARLGWSVLDSRCL